MLYQQSFKFIVAINIIYTFLFYLSFASLLFPLISGIIKIKTLSNSLRVLFFYIIISALTEASSYILTDKHLKAYFVIQNIFILLEFASLLLIYMIEYRSRTIRLVIASFYATYLVISFIQFYKHGINFQENSILSVSESIVLIIWAIYFFYKIQEEMKIPSLKDYSFFWLNCAILIYFSSALILFIFDDYLTRCSLNEFRKLWSLHLISNVAYNILMGMAIWKTNRK